MYGMASLLILPRKTHPLPHATATYMSIKLKGVCVCVCVIKSEGTAHCNTLQHTAKHTAIHCNTLQMCGCVIKSESTCVCMCVCNNIMVICMSRGHQDCMRVYEHKHVYAYANVLTQNAETTTASHCQTMQHTTTLLCKRRGAQH